MYDRQLSPGGAWILGYAVCRPHVSQLVVYGIRRTRGSVFRILMYVSVNEVGMQGHEDVFLTPIYRELHRPGVVFPFMKEAGQIG